MLSAESLQLTQAAAGFQAVGVVASGMGLVFWLTDRSSPTSRALALLLLCVGASTFANSAVVPMILNGEVPWWAHVLGFIEAGAFWAGTEWGLRVARTVTLNDGERGSKLIRLAQLLALVYAVTCALYPEARVQEFLLALERRELRPGFFLFAVPPVLAGLLVYGAGIGLLRAKPDRAERARIIAVLVAMPLLSSAIILPARWSPLALALGEVVFLLGALRYHVLQGVRAQFMERFLAPQVAELVRDRGMKAAITTRRQRVSIVCCDIRGFTAYAAKQPPEQIVRLLREFYAAVGKASLAAGGTIKDLAGDGALILIGAPVAFEDHATRALKLASHLQREVPELLGRFHPDLGLGVGVASGDVAVGIAGDGARLEYVAVGPAVNLASRFCDLAAHREIRTDRYTLERADGSDYQASAGTVEQVTIKGLEQPVDCFRFAPGTYPA